MAKEYKEKEYDIIVVGGGPGGLVAAWTAATLEANVLCLEEHPEIGQPRHCTTMVQGSNFTEWLFKNIDNRVIVNPYTKYRIFSPKGKHIADISAGGRGCCFVLREEFDKELARAAVRAGAELRLNTRVEGLWKEDGRVKGVVTKGGDTIRGQVVIAADGLSAFEKGIPRQEALVPPERQHFGGALNVEFTNMGDLEAGVIEFHPVDFLNLGKIYTRDSTSCVHGFESLKVFERVKALNHPSAKKFKYAVPIRIMGFRWPVLASMPKEMQWWWPVGKKLPKIAKDGLLLVGEAAGYCGSVMAGISGKYAAQVAVRAIQDKDTSEASLLPEYENLCQPLNEYNPPESSLAALQAPGLTEEEVEERLREFVRENRLKLLNQLSPLV